MTVSRTTGSSPESSWSTREVGELSRVWPGARFRSPPGPFVADVARVRLGDVVVESLRVTPHSCAREETAVGAGSRAISIEVVTDGAMWRADASGRYLQREGEVAITWTDEPFAYGWQQRGGLLRSLVPLDSVRKRIAGAADLPSGLLTDRPRLQSYVAFMTRVIDSVIYRAEIDVEFERAVWWLQLALLKDVTRTSAMSAAPASGLGARIDDHVEAHLFDPDLSVSSIARALGVSVRSVHNAFNGRDTTATRSIRRARVRAVAGSLRLEDPRTHRADAAIAAEFGFPSAEAQQRAFLEEFGVRVHAYRRSFTG